MKMNYDEFKNWLREEAVKAIPEGYEYKDVVVKDIVKPDKSYTGLCIVPKNDLCAPVFNIDGYYESYLDGTPLDSFLETINKAFRNIPEFSLPDFEDYESLKDRLFVKLRNVENISDEMLAEIPHTDYEDLVMTYHLRTPFTDDADDLTNVPITNDLLNAWDVSASKLHEDALNNSAKLLPMNFGGIGTLMGFGNDDDSPMRFITNNIQVEGSAAIFYPGVMDEVAEKMHGSYFLLPSSTHEFIAVPSTYAYDERNIDQLEDLVHMVNRSDAVPEGAVLSDNVYHYDADNHLFELGRRWKARLENKEYSDSLGEDDCVAEELDDPIYGHDPDHKKRKWRMS